MPNKQSDKPKMASVKVVKAEKKLEVVYTNKLNVRSKASLDGEIIAIVSKGDKFKEIKDKSNKEWACIEINKDLIGYALKAYLK